MKTNRKTRKPIPVLARQAGRLTWKRFTPEGIQGKFKITIRTARAVYDEMQVCGMITPRGVRK